MGKKSIEALVGLFVLLGMLGLVFLSLKAANLASFGALVDELRRRKLGGSKGSANGADE